MSNFVIVPVVTLLSTWVCHAAVPQPQRPGASPREAEAVRQWGLANGWAEAVPEEPAEPVYRPSDADQQRGFFVFAPDRNRIAPRDQMPAADAVPGRLQAVAFPGEFEGLGLCVRALNDLETVGIEVSDLTGPRGSVIRAVDVVIRDVIYAPLSLRNRRRKENRFKMHPMWLLRHKPSPLAQGTGRLCWLTVRCPAGAPAGRYTGTATVKAGGHAVGMPIELDLQPFKLDGDLCSWVPVTGGNGFNLDVYRQLAEHHCTGLSWWWGHWGLTVTRDGDRAAFDPAPLDLLNAVTRQAGMRGPWILMLGNMVRGHLERRIGGYYPTYRVPSPFEVKLVPRPKSPPGSGPAVADLTDREMDRRYVEVLQSLAARAKAQGYPQIIIIPYDEPTRYLKQWNAHWADLIREKVPEFKVLNTPQGVKNWATALMPHSDLMVVRGADDPIYNLAVKAGKGLVGYGRLTADQDFAGARHGLGLRFAEQQPNAIFFWSLNFGTLDERTPFNDLNERDSGARHRFAWPPLRPGRPWIETLVWEAQREGAKDYLLLLMLERALATSKTEAAGKVRAALVDFKREAARDPAGADRRRAQLATWYRKVMLVND